MPNIIEDLLGRLFVDPVPEADQLTRAAERLKPLNEKRHQNDEQNTLLLYQFRELYTNFGPNLIVQVEDGTYLKCMRMDTRISGEKFLKQIKIEHWKQKPILNPTPSQRADYLLDQATVNFNDEYQPEKILVANQSNINEPVQTVYPHDLALMSVWVTPRFDWIAQRLCQKLKADQDWRGRPHMAYNLLNE